MDIGRMPGETKCARLLLVWLLRLLAGAEYRDGQGGGGVVTGGGHGGHGHLVTSGFGGVYFAGGGTCWQYRTMRRGRACGRCRSTSASSDFLHQRAGRLCGRGLCPGLGAGSWGETPRGPRGPRGGHACRRSISRVDPSRSRSISSSSRLSATARMRIAALDARSSGAIPGPDRASRSVKRAGADVGPGISGRAR